MVRGCRLKSLVLLSLVLLGAAGISACKGGRETSETGALVSKSKTSQRDSAMPGKLRSEFERRQQEQKFFQEKLFPRKNQFAQAPAAGPVFNGTVSNPNNSVANNSVSVNSVPTSATLSGAVAEPKALSPGSETFAVPSNQSVVAVNSVGTANPNPISSSLGTASVLPAPTTQLVNNSVAAVASEPVVPRSTVNSPSVATQNFSNPVPANTVAAPTATLDTSSKLNPAPAVINSSPQVASVRSSSEVSVPQFALRQAAPAPIEPVIINPPVLTAAPTVRTPTLPQNSGQNLPTINLPALPLPLVLGNATPPVPVKFDPVPSGENKPEPPPPAPAKTGDGQEVPPVPPPGEAANSGDDGFGVKIAMGPAYEIGAAGPGQAVLEFGDGDDLPWASALVKEDACDPGLVTVTGRMIDCAGQDFSKKLTGRYLTVIDREKRIFIDAVIKSDNTFEFSWTPTAGSWDRGSGRPLTWAFFLSPARDPNIPINPMFPPGQPRECITADNNCFPTDAFDTLKLITSLTNTTEYSCTPVGGDTAFTGINDKVLSALSINTPRVFSSNDSITSLTIGAKCLIKDAFIKDDFKVRATDFLRP